MSAGARHEQEHRSMPATGKSLAELMTLRKASVAVSIPLGDGATYDFTVRYDPDAFTMQLARQLRDLGEADEGPFGAILLQMLTGWDLDEALTATVIDGMSFWVKSAIGNAILADWHAKFAKDDAGKAPNAEDSPTT